jgi:hypothetical protein
MKVRCDICRDLYILTPEEVDLYIEGFLETRICPDCEEYDELRPDDICEYMSYSDADSRL